MSMKNKNTHSQLVAAARLIAVLLCLLQLFCLNAVAGHDEAPLLESLKESQASLRGEKLQVPLLLQGIGRQAGINIYVAGNIEDTIDIDVQDLSLYEIFHVVMNAKQLHYYQKNNVIFVEKKPDFQGELRDQANKRLCTKYGNAAAYIEQLKTLLSPQGSIIIANRGNCLIVNDREPIIPRIEAMLSELDQPIPQVHIEARIVSISSEAKKRLGVIWGYNNYRDAAELATKINPITSSVDLSVTEPTTSLAFGFIRQNVNLNFTIQAMQEDNLLEILSSPRILVLDGKEAEIKQGQEVPYVTQSGDLINTSFREANLGLKVRPTVLQNDFLTLEVQVTNDSVDQTTTSGGEPLINKQEITTNLFLENNITVVIGGIVQHSKDNGSSKVPGLGDIPILGNLFKNKNKFQDKSELMVFITPKIVTMTQKSGADAEKTSTMNVDGQPLTPAENDESGMTPERPAVMTTKQDTAPNNATRDAIQE